MAQLGWLISIITSYKSLLIKRSATINIYYLTSNIVRLSKEHNRFSYISRLSGKPDSSDNCLMLSELLADSVATTIATLSGCPAADRISGGMLLLSYCPLLTQAKQVFYYIDFR